MSDAASPSPSTSAPHSPATGFDGFRERTQLDRVERDLLRDIQHIQSKLVHTRRNRSHRESSHFFRSSKNHQNIYSSSGRPFFSSASAYHQHAAPKRVLSVSLRLPHNDDRASVRQQLFDAAIPPKAVLSLPDAMRVPFVWIGSDPPEARTDPDSVVAKSVPTRTHQSHSSRARRRRHSPSSSSADPTLSAYYPANKNVHVPLPDDPEINHRYQRFSEHILWRLLHYDYVAVDDPDLMVYWAAYREVNQCFADAVAEICEEGDIIWVHNFHLMLFPAMLRELVPYARIGFFLYTPFPSAELFRILPHRVEILKGVIAADVIGFHSYDHAKQFNTSAKRLLTLETTPNQIIADPLTGRACKIGIYPGGIDADALRSHVTSKLVKSRVAELRARFEGVKVVVGVDRLDDCFAGLLHKLLAFERLLSDNPQLVKKVILVQAAMLPTPGRNLSTYREQKLQLNKCVARVNSAFGTWSYSPIHFINKVLDPTELHALMCVGHVCVVTTVRDGMGLVPHEWTICQRGAYNGPIVLSEFSSAAHSFSTALHVNPWDIDEVAAKIKVALDMGDVSRHARNEAAYRFVTSQTAKQWGMNFLDDIDTVQRPPFPYIHSHQQQQQLKSVSTDAASGNPLLSSPSLMKPMLDTSAVVHAYLGTSTNTNSPFLSSSAMSPNYNGSSTTPQVTANIASSPQFVYGEHLSKMMRQSSIVASASSIPSLTKPSSQSFDSTNSLNTTDSGDDPPSAPTSSNSPAKHSKSHYNGNDTISASRHSITGDDAYAPSTRATSCRACLFILDIDGTLMTTSPHEKVRRQQYNVPSHVIEVIQSLVDASIHNYVMVTSCHSREALLRSFGHMRVYLAAEDGAFFREPNSSSWSLLFRDSGVSSGGNSGSSGGGRRQSPGNTINDGDQYIPSPNARMQVGATEAGNIDEQSVQSRIFAADRENFASARDRDVITAESETGKDEADVNGSNSSNSNNSTSAPKDIPKSDTKVTRNFSGSNMASSPTYGTFNASNIAAPGLSASKNSMSTHTSFSSVELGQGETEINTSWKESVMPVLKHFAERTPGVILHEGETLVTWEYGDVECDYGHWQSRQVHKHLEQSMLRGLAIGISCEEGIQRRWIRVRPKDVDKAKAVQKFIKSVLTTNNNKTNNGSSGSEERDSAFNNNVPAVRVDFIVCFGNDRADEPIFEFLHDRERLRKTGVSCSQGNIFTCKVGAPLGRTAAATCLDGPARVVQVLKAMCGKDAWAMF